jgi:hypothetical protein
MERRALLLAAALLGPGGASAMIWHPKNPKNAMWDTWLYAQPGQDAVPKFYMNYLSSCDASCGGPPSKDPKGCCGWNGVGATISSDGVHYDLIRALLCTWTRTREIWAAAPCSRTPPASTS